MLSSLKYDVRCLTTTKGRLCYEPSCDGTLVFCAEHLPAPPTEEVLEGAYKSLEAYVTQKALKEQEKIDYSYRAAFASRTLADLKAESMESMKSYTQLCQVLVSYSDLAKLCSQLDLENPFYTLYKKTNALSRAHYDNWTYLKEFAEELEEFGWISTTHRGHVFQCYECAFWGKYESDEEPIKRHCEDCYTHLLGVFNEEWQVIQDKMKGKREGQIAGAFELCALFSKYHNFISKKGHREILESLKVAFGTEKELENEIERTLTLITLGGGIFEEEGE